MSFNILSTKKVSDRQYNFTVSFNNQTYQFNASVNPDTGKWLLPTADISSVNPIYQNAVRTACSQLGQYLAKNPLYIDTKTINGTTGKRIFKRNPIF